MRFCFVVLILFCDVCFFVVILICYCCLYSDIEYHSSYQPVKCVLTFLRQILHKSDDIAYLVTNVYCHFDIKQ